MTMNALTPFRTIESSCEQALEWTMRQLTQAGLRPMQTFDLQTVRGVSGGPPCPQHGSEGCDCRMVVLLVYGEAGGPVTLILHGNDGQTWISIPENPQAHAGGKLIPAIRQALALDG